VRATRRDGAAVTGRVRGADEDAVTLDVDGTEHTLRYDELSSGRVQVEFSHGEES
jgi:ribosome maturation factor RimP